MANPADAFTGLIPQDPRRLLDDLISRDPQRIWSASCAVHRLRAPEPLAILVQNLDLIRTRTAGINLGGALRANASHLAFALRKLEFVRDERGCLCALYPLYDLYNPANEAAAGNIRITGTTHVANTDGTVSAYVDFYACDCALCPARFRVEEREYHYTWWAWRLI
jgi:hypothetical protein